MHLHNDIQQEPCSQISVRAFMFPAVIMVKVSPVLFFCSSATSLLTFFFNLYIRLFMTLPGLFCSTSASCRALKRHYVTFYITLSDLISHPKWLFPMMSSVDGSHRLLCSSSKAINSNTSNDKANDDGALASLETHTSFRHLAPVNLDQSAGNVIPVWKQLKKK